VLVVYEFGPCAAAVFTVRNSIGVARLLTTAKRMKPLYACANGAKRHLASEHGIRRVRSFLDLPKRRVMRQPRTRSSRALPRAVSRRSAYQTLSEHSLSQSAPSAEGLGTRPDGLAHGRAGSFLTGICAGQQWLAGRSIYAARPFRSSRVAKTIHTKVARPRSLERTARRFRWDCLIR
jgi:hypothetical protein